MLLYRVFATVNLGHVNVNKIFPVSREVKNNLLLSQLIADTAVFPRIYFLKLYPSLKPISL